MRSENMSKSHLTAYHITKILFPYRKSRSLNTIMTADFGPKIELTLFLRMRAKEIAKSLRKCIPIEELFPYYRKSRSPGKWRGQVFDRKLRNRRFCA